MSKPVHRFRKSHASRGGGSPTAPVRASSAAPRASAVKPIQKPTQATTTPSASKPSPYSVSNAASSASPRSKVVKESGTGSWGPKSPIPTVKKAQIEPKPPPSVTVTIPAPALAKKLSKPTNQQVKEVISQHETRLAEEEIKRLGKRFQKLDVDSSGSISLEEFHSIESLGKNPLVDRIVAVFDIDRNGEVDFREFILGMSQFTHHSTSEARQRFAFRIYDMDNDGYISPGELYQVVSLMCGKNLTPAQAQQLVDHTFMMCDTDGDGRISFQEFCAATKDVHAYESLVIDSFL